MTKTIKTSENIHRALLEAMQTFVALIELDGTLSFTNQTPLKAAGLQASDVLGKKFWDCPWFAHDPEVRALLRASIEAAATGEEVAGEIQINTLQGTLWINFSLRPLMVNGKISQLIGEGNDISEKHRLRKEAAFAQRRLQGLFDDMQTMVAILDTEGYVTLVNNTPLIAADIDQTEVLGQRLWECPWFSGDPATQQTVKTDVRDALSGQATLGDVQILTPEGRVWVEFSIHPVFDDDGKVVQLLAEGRDPSTRRQVEEEREQVLFELQEREQNLAITLDSIGDAVITTDAAGQITRMNPIAEKLTGWPFSEAQQLPLSSVFAIFNAITGKALASPVDKLMASGEIVHLSSHTTLRARDNREYQISDSAAPIRDKNGLILGSILVFSDVTEQYRLREQAKESQQQLQGLLDDMQTMVGLYNPDGTLTFINNTPLLTTGFNRADVIGKKLWESPFFNFSEETKSRVRSDMASAAAGHNTLSDIEIMTQQGGHFWIALSFHPVYDDNGLVVQIVGEARDITARKNAEDELRASAQQLRRYRDQAPLAAIEMDIEQRVVGWNAEAEKMFGYRFEEIKGQPFTLIIPNERILVDSQRIWDDLANIRSGASVTSEFKRKDGSTFYAQCHNAPFIGEAGEVIGAGAILRDITSERTAQKALLHSEKNQREILDSMVEGIVVTNETGAIISINKAAEKLLGYSADELIGRPVTLLLKGQTEAIFQDNMQRYLKSGDLRQIGMGIEVDVICKNQNTFPTLLAVAELSHAGNEKRRFISSFRNLSGFKQQEEQLRRSQKMDALGKLTGGIAHDFNNMLGIVTGYADLLGNALINEEKLALYAHEIHRAGERGAKLTRKLLSFSQQTAVSADSIDINALINSQQHMLATSLTPRIKLVYELCDKIWPVSLDRDDFEDAIINICINAMHAIEANGRVTIHTENVELRSVNAQQKNLPSGDYVLLSISDSGKGMNEATKQRIFDPFYTTKGDEGTGLGLSQVYGFMERCKGAIDVTSLPGKGTQLRMYFPKDKTLSDIDTPDNATSQTGLRGNETILVVDDEARLLSLCTEILGQQGYRVLPANSCSEALQLLDANKVDLLFSDVVMPDMDGYELALIVAQKYPDIKIQMTSGFTDDRQNALGDDSLHQNLLVKPYRAQALLSRIRTLLDTTK